MATSAVSCRLRRRVAVNQGRKYTARLWCVLVVLMGGITLAAEPASSSPELQPAQKEALIELIRSLEKLKAQPESTPAITQWIAEEKQRSETELKTLESQAQQLQTQLSDIQKKRQML